MRPVITIYFDGDQTLWDFRALMRRTLGLTIEELRRLGVDDDDLAVDHNIGLLSNGNSYPDRVGLQRYFGAAVFSQDVGAEKPDPAIYLAAQSSCTCRCPRGPRVR